MLLKLHANEVPLIPKLRGQFAEFLNEGSLARLRILTLPTCVGLRYGHLTASLEVFLDSMVPATSLLYFAPHQLSGFWKTVLPVFHPTALDVLFQPHA